MLKSAIFCFKELAIIFVSAYNWVSFSAFFFSAYVFVTYLTEMLISASVSKTSITSIVVITMNQIFIKKNFCVLSTVFIITCKCNIVGIHFFRAQYDLNSFNLLAQPVWSESTSQLDSVAEKKYLPYQHF